MRLFIVFVIMSVTCCCLPGETPAAEPRLSSSGIISAVARVEFSSGLTPVRAMAATRASADLAPLPSSDKTDDVAIIPFRLRYLVRLPGTGDLGISITRGDVVERLYYSPILRTSPPGLSPGPTAQTLYFDLAARPGAADITVTVAYLDN